MAYCGGGGGGAGGAGSRGGGAVSLIAKNGLHLSGSIYAAGSAYSGNGSAGVTPTGWPGGAGGQGGHATQSGGRISGTGGAGNTACVNDGRSGGTGKYGGTGAGGGVLLRCDGPWGVTVSGSIATTGGSGTAAANFGSTKIFGVKGRISITGANFQTGWNNSYGSPLQAENKMWIHPCC